MNEAFREFLYRPWTLSERLSTLLENYAVLDSACKSMTANYNKVGGSSGGGNSCDGPWATTADLITKIRDHEKRLADAEAQVDELCKTLPPRGRDVLHYRYVLRLPWETIRDTMQAKGYRCSALRTLFYWHEEAIKHAEQIWRYQNDFTDE